MFRFRGLFIFNGYIKNERGDLGIPLIWRQYMKTRSPEHRHTIPQGIILPPPVPPNDRLLCCRGARQGTGRQIHSRTNYILHLDILEPLKNQWADSPGSIPWSTPMYIRLDVHTHAYIYKYRPYRLPLVWCGVKYNVPFLQTCVLPVFYHERGPKIFLAHSDRGIVRPEFQITVPTFSVVLSSSIVWR